jgi:hypothetical protein
MLDCHVNAFLLAPGRVLGRRLRPLTLRHLWLLEAAGSPYAFHAAPIYSDTVFAVFVLSLPFWAARWLIMRPGALAACFRWWGRRQKGVDVPGDMAAFSAYWQAYTAMADPIESKNGSARESCLPSSVKIAWAIMGKTGERRAWTMPVPLALSYFTAECEFNGQEYSTERRKALAAINDAAIREADGRMKAAANG